MKHLPRVLFGLVFMLLTAPVALAWPYCWTCREGPCVDPEMWWPCATCVIADPGEPGDFNGCAMFPDGSCVYYGGNACTGVGAARFTETWRVALVRPLGPAGPDRVTVTATILAAANPERGPAHRNR